MTDEQINTIIAKEINSAYKDFCNNHEAMIEAENFLMKIDEVSWDDYYCSFEKGLCSSTTRQRAENYLKVFGEWKE
jgi:hypothetical protein